MTEFDLFDLRERANNDDYEAVDELIELATERGDFGERGDMDLLRHLADRGNRDAADQLIELATELATSMNCGVSPRTATPRPRSSCRSSPPSETTRRASVDTVSGSPSRTPEDARDFGASNGRTWSVACRVRCVGARRTERACRR